MHAFIAYNACMNSIQYTIRSIPPSVDAVLRLSAKQQGTSLNEAIVRALQKATGVTEERTVYSDLDKLFGGGIDDTQSFDHAMKNLAAAPLTKDFKL